MKNHHDSWTFPVDHRWFQSVLKSEGKKRRKVILEICGFDSS